MSSKYDAGSFNNKESSKLGKVNNEDRERGTFSRSCPEESVVKVAWVEGGSTLGFGRRFEVGIVTVKIDAAERERSDKRRKVIENCMIFLAQQGQLVASFNCLYRSELPALRSGAQLPRSRLRTFIGQLAKEALDVYPMRQLGLPFVT